MAVASAAFGTEPAAAAHTVEVQWDSTPACIETAVLPERVGALLGATAVQPLAVGLTSERLDRGWRVDVRLSPEAMRTLEGPDCATLTDAVALVIAVHADAVAVAESAPLQTTALEPAAPVFEPEPTASKTSRAPAAPMRRSERPPPSRARDQSPPPTRPRAQLGAAVMGELSVLPRHAAAFELSAGIAWRWASVELGLLTSVGPDGRAAQQPDLGGRFRLYTGMIRGCASLVRGRFELPVCGALELGDLRASGRGVTEPQTIDALWLAGVVGTRPGLRLGTRVVLGGVLDLVAPLRRHRFSIEDDRLVHVLPAIAPRLGVALRIRLP